jgi:thiamine-monophosphate kinase
MRPVRIRKNLLSPTLHAIGENELIRRIAQWMAPRAASPRSAPSIPSIASIPSTASTPSPKSPPWAKQDILVAIGDDTALVRQSKGAPPLAITTDMLVEGTHFLPSQPPESLGKKAGNSNLSDLAAVGAWPAWVLVSLGAPGKTPAAWVEAFYRGLRSVLDPFGCLCVGGDCVRAPQITINIVAGGYCAPDAVSNGLKPALQTIEAGRSCAPDGGAALPALPLRSRAKPGQELYVTGTLGDSGAGLFLLRHPLQEKKLRAAGVNTAALIARHQEGASRIHAGIAIARHCPDAAMMDLSDGLAADLPRMAEASGCGFEVSAAVLPLSPALRRFASLAGLSADLGRRDARPNPSGRRDARPTLTDFALFGGEDYELVFTTAATPERWHDGVAHAAPGRPLRLTRIGRVVRGSGVRFLDAQGREIRGNRSFEHF